MIAALVLACIVQGICVEPPDPKQQQAAIERLRKVTCPTVEAQPWTHAPCRKLVTDG